MQCRTHPTAHAEYTCNTCGEWLCEACCHDIDNRIFCPACLEKTGATVPPPTPAPRPPRRIRWGLSFIFSFLPGANYMYMGLMKRGLAAMCGFFLLIYLLTVVWGSFIGGPLTVLLFCSIPVFALTCTFDGFNIRRRLLAGEVVPDNIDNVLEFLRRNKKVLIMMLIVVAGLGVVGRVIGVLLEPIRRLIPLLIIALGVYVVARKKKA